MHALKLAGLAQTLDEKIIDDEPTHPRASDFELPNCQITDGNRSDGTGSQRPHTKGGCGTKPDCG